MMHVGLGRAHPLHVEYVHLGVALAFINDIMTEAILSHPRLHMQRKMALVKALGKVIWIQNDLFAKWQVRDGDEFRQPDEEVVIEKEGYLNGKKILSDSDGEADPAAVAAAAAAPTSPTAGTCPFSGIRISDVQKPAETASVSAPAPAATS